MTNLSFKTPFSEQLARDWKRVIAHKFIRAETQLTQLLTDISLTKPAKPKLTVAYSSVFAVWVDKQAAQPKTLTEEGDVSLRESLASRLALKQ